MTSGWFVTANDITHWTQIHKRQAEGTLPKLIYKLILASVKPEAIRRNPILPYDDGINRPDYDGIVEIEEGKGNEFVPDGCSVWEIKTTIDKKINGEFNKDYKKRTEKPGAINRAETTFIFTTSRAWTKKHDWISDKLQESKWSGGVRDAGS